MKTAKLVIGIISMVFFPLIVFQSCAVGLLNTLKDTGESSGLAGMGLAFFMLIAGIVGVCTRKSKGGGIVSGVFYLLGWLLGIGESNGVFADLAIWSILCLIFATVFIIGSLRMKTKEIDETDKTE